MGDAVEYKVLVYLVTENKNIGAADDFLQGPYVVFTQYGAGRIVWRVEHDHPRLWANAALHKIPVDAVIRRLEVDQDRTGAIDFNIWYIAVVSRFKNDHLLAWLEHCCEGSINRVGSPGGYGDLCVGICIRSI